MEEHHTVTLKRSKASATMEVYNTHARNKEVIVWRMGGSYEAYDILQG